jgi:hypothetical protein
MTDGTVTPAKPTAGKKALGVITTVIAALAGMIGSRFFGVAFWIPFVLICIAVAILRKSEAPSYLIPVLSITIGHTLWIGVAIALLSSIGDATLEAQITTVCEVVVVGLLTWWILRTQSMASLSAIILLDLVGYIVPLMNLDARSSLIAAILMHIILRTAGIAAAIYAMVNRPKPPPNEASVVALPSMTDGSHK